MNIAIIGLGHIAHRVAKGIMFAKGATLYAVASRNKENAQAFAQTYKANVYYDTYDALIQDDKVDVIYLCTPNHLHFEQIKQCMKYHKHVICEKPLVSSSDEVKALFTYAKQQNCFLMEAEKTVFTPLNQTINEMIQAGVIGKLKQIKASYCYVIEDAGFLRDHWAFDDVYGGCSYDVGVYPICFANYYAKANIQQMEMHTIQKEGYVCDFGMQGNVTYENGIVAQLHSSWLETSEHKGYGYLIGDEGYFEIPEYWKGNSATLVKNDHRELIEVHMDSDFTGQIEHAIKCIQEGLLQSPLMGEAQSLAIMKVLEATNEYRKK